MKEGRDASLVLSEKDPAKPADMKKMETLKSMKAVRGASQVSEAGPAALKKEMKANYERKASERRTFRAPFRPARKGGLSPAARPFP